MPRVAALKKAFVAVADAAIAAESKSLTNGSRAFSSLSGPAGRALAAEAPASLLPAARQAVGAALASKARCPCGRMGCIGRHFTTSSAAAHAQPAVAPSTDAPSLAERYSEVAKHFPTAMTADDLLARVEVALAAFGFTGDNAIAMSNLCRDESCLLLEDKIEAVFGSCFSTHGLGGVLTCGVIGMGAGLSHSPVEGGKERYVFFSFPHIAIDSNGKVGAISRPGRPGASAACGALIKTMLDLKAEGLEAGVKGVGTHDPLEPEFSILKSRVARMIQFEGGNPDNMDLVDVTKVAERVITADLEFLISKAVDPKKADYAVITGVQIHNWAHDLEDENVPSMEFAAPARTYVVVDGVKTELDLHKVPGLSPRQLSLLAARSSGGVAPDFSSAAAGAILQDIPRDYLIKRLGGVQTGADVTGTPGWKDYIKATYERSTPAGAPTMEH